MNVQRAIHETWSAHAPLARLLAADHFFTGKVPVEDAQARAMGLPYAALAIVGDYETQRTSSGTQLVRCLLRFSIYTAQYTLAKEIAAEVLARFNRATFVSADGRVLDMKPANRSETEQDNGAWRIAMDFDTRFCDC